VLRCRSRVFKKGLDNNTGPQHSAVNRDLFPAAQLRSDCYRDGVLMSMRVLASENWCEGNSAFSLRIPVVNEERMRKGCWLRLVL